MGIPEKTYIARYEIRAQTLQSKGDFQYEPTTRNEMYEFKARDDRIAYTLADQHRSSYRHKYILPQVKLRSVLEKTIDEQIQQAKKEEESQQP